MGPQISSVCVCVGVCVVGVMARTLTEWVCLLQISSDITGCDYNMERMWPRGGTEHNVLNFNRTQTTISWSSDPSEINRETSHVSSSSSTYLDTHSPLWLRLNCFAFVWSGGSFVYQRTGTSGNRSKGKIFALGPITIMLRCRWAWRCTNPGFLLLWRFPDGERLCHVG